MDGGSELEKATTNYAEDLKAFDTVEIDPKVESRLVLKIESVFAVCPSEASNTDILSTQPLARSSHDASLPA